LSPEDLSLRAFDGARVVHLSGITPALSGACAAAVRRAMEVAHEIGAVVSFDPNYRAPLWDTATARATLTDLIQSVDLLLMSDEDAQVLFGETDAVLSLERAAALGPRTVILKQAALGAAALADGAHYHVPAKPVRKVVDTVGAGDGFNAGFLAGLISGWKMERCLALGAEIGAKAVAKLGDYAGYPRSRGSGKREGGRARR
jgi:2-dehydro-3-deoxygluconokinase